MHFRHISVIYKDNKYKKTTQKLHYLPILTAPDRRSNRWHDIKIEQTTADLE